ncbi:MAG: hypothetical protein IJ814_04155 [Paludibacteraceae bacterium]|nr:hypothetical protein [Paludibacteraceae bacterium]
MNLKERIFNYLRKKQPERTLRFPHFDRPLSVLVIFESDMLEQNNAVKTIQQDLRRKGMNVSTWGFAPKKAKDITSPVLPQSRIVGLDDYNLFGKLRQEVAEDLCATRYDLMLDLSTRPLLPLRYMAMYAQADFKAGLNLGEGIHDMLISPPDLNTEQARPEITWLYHLLIQYISTIQSRD